jgi:flagellar basal-body rod protein FlgB
MKKQGISVWRGSCIQHAKGESMNGQALFSSTTIPVLEQMVDFAQSRHNVLAGNLANLDTPGYRVRDLSQKAFEGQLKEAIRTRDRAPDSDWQTSARPNAISQVADEVKGITYHDEGNVGIEQQVAEMAKNQTRHNVALAILTSQFRLLQAAISERA